MKVLQDETATVAAGAALGQALIERYDGSALVFLLGNLGAGKTTFARGLIQGFGHSGAVKSPTYTLLEPYELEQGVVYHFDLYRISDPQELEFVGIDEIIDGSGIKLFEWPERATDWLPDPDVTVELEVNEYAPNARNLTIVYR
ncbi:MAG: tRNA (adenosine(37)-N6)-threonylcarbamoyltransferase complex ATPase subunit type 1 TsaE [Pseudomonadota bacterium]